MNSLLYRALSWLIVVASLSVTSLAFAQKSTAEKFGDAVDLFVEGKCDEALPVFREVHFATESPNARLYIARCLQKQGDLPAAYNEMKATVADATKRAATEPKYAETRDAAAAELAILEPKIGRIVVAVAEAPEGVTAEVDGAPVPVGIPFAVPIGTLTVVVDAPGHPSVTREADIAAGKTTTVALTFGATEAAPKPPPEEPEEPETTAPFLTDVRIVGMVIAGLGVAGMVVFAVTGSMAKSEFDELSTLCNDSTCPASEAERVADGRTLTTVANVSVGVGGVALLVGAAMIIFGGDDGESEAPDTTAITVRPVVGPGYLGLTGTF